MNDTPVIKHKIIYIRTLAHKSGGLYIAVSDDIPGLSIAGLSTEEIEGKLDGAIRDFLEMSGCEVISIELSRDARFAMPDFGPPAFIAEVAIAAACFTF
jgi:hypothetical protein